MKRKAPAPLTDADFPLQVAPPYAVRFIAPSDALALVNLYHLERTALSGDRCGRYERMLWASKWFSREHPQVTASGAYKDLDGLLQ